MMDGNIEKVSVHGGHSGQFCNHAKDSLEDIVRAYISQGFAWVGITEHIPPLADEFRYPDEVEDGLSASFLQARFEDYFRHCRALGEKYRASIEIFAAFETETYQGSADYVKRLVEKLRPDYIVGSVHHVRGIGIDVNRELYKQAVAAAGGVKQLYCDYFDAQHAMLEALRPAVVGHFDLIRIFDPDSVKRLAQREIWERVTRNLEFMARENLIMDFNLRGFDRAREPYPCLPVLRQALSLGLALVPGDDSHGVSSVGRNYDKGLEILASLGADTRWQRPRLIQY